MLYFLTYHHQHIHKTSKKWPVFNSHFILNHLVASIKFWYSKFYRHVTLLRCKKTIKTPGSREAVAYLTSTFNNGFHKMFCKVRFSWLKLIETEVKLNSWARGFVIWFLFDWMWTTFIMSHLVFSILSHWLHVFSPFFPLNAMKYRTKYQTGFVLNILAISHYWTTWNKTTDEYMQMEFYSIF